MPNVVVSKRSQIRVTVQDRGGILVPPAVGNITLNNQGAAQAAVTTLANLTDVNETTIPPLDKSTLVYNANTSKYDVKVADLDGGTF